MKSRVLVLWRRLRAIPSTLRGFTILLWVLGAVATVAPILPGWEDENGRDVSLHQLWSEGAGLMCMGFGLGMILLGMMIYKGWAWVRHMLMFGIVAIALSGFVRPEYETVPIAVLVIVASIPILIGLWYFYFRREVVAYFTGK